MTADGARGPLEFPPIRSLADRVPLAGGTTMPRLGLGTYRSAEGEEVEQEVACALEIGYRGIDTASLYGNESGVGAAIRASGIPRGELFVTTKVWDDEQGYAGTPRAGRAPSESATSWSTISRRSRPWRPCRLRSTRSSTTPSSSSLSFGSTAGPAGSSCRPGRP